VLISRQGNAYIDRATVTLSGGRGGDGCVSFYHAPFSPDNTPPDGAGGGRGGNVYLRVTPDARGLGHLASIARAGQGTPGQGDNRIGERGADLVLDVPIGTTVKERRLPSEWPPVSPDGEEPPLEADWDAYSEWEMQRRNRIFIFYPGLKGDETTPTPEDERFFRAEAEHLLWERTQRRMELTRRPIDLDLVEHGDDPVLVAMGGEGGRGNAIFAGGYCRLPKFGTRGQAGQRVTLELELKSLADVGLVGFPNSGKSTLLRAMSNSRAEVAPYPFTTLAPHLGTVVVYDDGTFGDGSTSIIDDSPAYRPLHSADDAPVEPDEPAVPEGRHEAFRMRVADCPGILLDASANVGLGRDFLRHIERSPVLAYVLDLSSGDPVATLRTLRAELEAYRPGLSSRAALVVANKADLVADEARARDLLAGLRADVGVDVPVLPLSAKHRHNVPLVVRLLRTAVTAARSRAAASEPDRAADRRLRLAAQHASFVERAGVLRRAGGVDYRVHATAEDRAAAQAVYDAGLRRAKIEDARWAAEQGERRRSRVAAEAERKRAEWEERRRVRRGEASVELEAEVDRRARAFAQGEASIDEVVPPASDATASTPATGRPLNRRQMLFAARRRGPPVGVQSSTS
jgi:GTP-binding protein